MQAWSYIAILHFCHAQSQGWITLRGRSAMPKKHSSLFLCRPCLKSWSHLMRFALVQSWPLLHPLAKQTKSVKSIESMESMAVEWTWSFAMIVCDPANLFPRTCFWGTTFSAQRCHMRFQPLTCALYFLQSESSHASPNLKAFRKWCLSTKYIPSMIFCKRYMNLHYLHCSCNQ